MAKAPKTAKSTPAKPKSASGEKPKAVDDGVHPVARPFLWLGSRGVQRNFMWLIGVLMVVFTALDLVFPRYGYFSLDKSVGFYSIFGFLAFTFVVLMGWPLRKLTGRSEDYYDDGEPDA